MGAAVGKAVLKSGLKQGAKQATRQLTKQVTKRMTKQAIKKLAVQGAKAGAKAAVALSLGAAADAGLKKIKGSGVRKRKSKTRRSSRVKRLQGGGSGDTLLLHPGRSPGIWSPQLMYKIKRRK